MQHTSDLHLALGFLPLPLLLHVQFALFYQITSNACNFEMKLNNLMRDSQNSKREHPDKKVIIRRTSRILRTR